MACGDIDELPDEAQLLRLSRDDEDHLIWDADIGGWLINPKRLQLDEVGDSAGQRRELSTYWFQHIEFIHSLGPDSILRDGYPLIYSVSAGEARSIRANGIEFAAKHSPIGSVLPDCAHCSIEHVHVSEGQRRLMRTLLAGRFNLRWGHSKLSPPTGA